MEKTILSWKTCVWSFCHYLDNKIWLKKKKKKKKKKKGLAVLHNNFVHARLAILLIGAKLPYDLIISLRGGLRPMPLTIFLSKACYMPGKGIGIHVCVRDRPFNLQGGGLCFFFSFRIFFSDNTRVRIFIFFCRAEREFFFQNLTLGYMTKTLNLIIFFFLHQNQNIFSATLGIRIFF